MGKPGGWYSISATVCEENCGMRCAEGVYYIDTSMLRALKKELKEKAIDFSIVKINDDRFDDLKNLVPKLILLESDSDEPEDFTQDWTDHSGTLSEILRKLAESI